MLFEYKALTKEGEARDGSIDALNRDIAIRSLQERGLTIVSISGGDKKPFWEIRLTWFDRVPNRDVVILSRQIATLFLAEVSALRVFRLLADESENVLLRSILSDVAQDIQGGSSISEAMSKHPSVFSNFYVNMVRAGEEAGKLNETFAYLADYLDRSYALTIKTRNALIYPAFVLSVFVVVIVLLLTLVFPRLTSILTEAGQDIPVYTQIVISISNFLVNYGIFLLVLLVAGGIWAWKFAATDRGKMYFGRLLITVPVLGGLTRRLYLSRIADNMYTMLSSGISIVRALEVTSTVVGNAVYRELLLEAAEGVKTGRSISEMFTGHKEIPNIMVQILKVGEETGELGNILKTLSNFYQREVNDSIDTFIGLIEPALIVGLAACAGLLLSSVLLPIYNLSSGI
ncbi:MAG: type II secretion system F family protein [Parcubacteria group bacterium]|nr:type II secretion system F family protein [Parcubacteria group bacterium]